MQKHPQIKSSIQPSGICAFGSHIFIQMPLSKFAYKRYTTKSVQHYSPSAGTSVYSLPCGCYVWVHASGSRTLSALPF